MQKLPQIINTLIFVILICAHQLLISQTLLVGNTYNSEVESQTKYGINAAYSFLHILDENYEISPEVKDILFETNFDLMRFPGGAVGNYYRFNGPGYGMIKSEVENVANTLNCNGSNLYCFEKDEDAPRNYIHDLVEYVNDRFEATARKTELLYVINVLLHYVYNLEEIETIDDINNLHELDSAFNNGTISPDFYERILENYNAISHLIQEDNIDIVGIEMGNEFYFYQEVTTFSYVQTNVDPSFNLNQSLAAIDQNITRYISLINLYKRLLRPLQNDLPFGVPSSNINFLGGQPNAGLVWNQSIRDRVAPHVDALIPHIYISTDGPTFSYPESSGANDDGGFMVEIKENIERWLNNRFDRTIIQIADYYELESSGLELWLTEWNIQKNFSLTNIWDEWAGTFLHGAFLNMMMQKISTGVEESKFIKKAILHGWTGSSSSFGHSMVSANEDGSATKRISFHANKVGAHWKSGTNTRLSGTLNHEQNEEDFYTEAYHHITQINDTVINKLIIEFANLRSDIISTHFRFGDASEIIIDGNYYDVLDGQLVGYSGLNNSSTCGISDFNDDESEYNISPFELPVNDREIFEIPGYTTGIIEFKLKSNEVIITPVGIVEQNLESANIYPNPTSDFISIELPKNIDLSKLNVKLTNSIGQIVHQSEVVSYNVTLAVNDYATGVYFVSILDDENEGYYSTFVKK